MNWTRAETEEISAFVITQMKRRGVDLTEGERQRLIAIAHRIGREQGLNRAGWESITATLEWEISLIPAVRKLGEWLTIWDATRGKMPHEASVMKYLDKTGLRLGTDRLGHYVKIPKGYSVSEVRAKIREIQRNGCF